MSWMWWWLAVGIGAVAVGVVARWVLVDLVLDVVGVPADWTSRRRDGDRAIESR
ncbi:MAG: hypothetical protein KIT14_06405 [bacterium]|nr:hypothetical protein [bacterium]